MANRDIQIKGFVSEWRGMQTIGDTNSVFYTKAKLQKILRKKGCGGINFHLALEDGKLRVFAEPANADGDHINYNPQNALMRDMGGTGGGEGGPYFEPDAECPTNCPKGG
jgi:hypothetical protein